MGHKSITRVQAAKVVNLLQTVYDEKIGNYQDGWSDEKIREHLIEIPMGVNTVGDLRREMYGNFKKASPSPTEARFVTLEDKLTLMEHRLQGICSQLGIDWQSLTNG